MKTRKITIAMLLLLGMWQAALAFSPGGEEKGGKSKDAQGLSNHASPAEGALLAEQAALNATELEDQSSAESPDSYIPSNTSNIKSPTQLGAVIERRQSEQLATIKRAELRKTLKATVKANKKQGHNATQPEAPYNDDLVLYVILAILIPPLAVGLYEGGLTTNFWICLLLSLFFWVPGIIFALVVILSN